MNFAEILDIGAARTPNAEAISQGERAVTYDELRSRTLHVAGLLHSLDLAPDTKVAVLMHNDVEYAEIGFGIMGAGNVLLPVNPRLRPPEVGLG